MINVFFFCFFLMINVTANFGLLVAPCAHKGGLAVGVNAKPMGARTLVEGSLIQLKVTQHAA